jgi:hypothetical protein
MFGLQALTGDAPMTQSVHAGAEGAFLQLVRRDRLAALRPGGTRRPARTRGTWRSGGVRPAAPLPRCAETLAELAGRPSNAIWCATSA